MHGTVVPRLSVIICSYNPRGDYLRRVLDSLQGQTLARAEWELLLVDNDSQEHLAGHWDLSWHPNHIHVREHERGLTPARIRGITQASGELLVFVDDDNVLRPDYLECAAILQRRYPYLGAFGAGVLEPDYEVEPLPRVAPWLQMLALRRVAGPFWTNHCADFTCVPWGAGLCVTREVAAAYAHWVGELKISHVLDRRGEHLFCGGDDLFAFASARAGLGFGVFPELRITHLIPACRVGETYLLRLLHDHAYSHGILRYKLFGDEPRKWAFLQGGRILLHGLRRGRFSMRSRWAAARGAAGAARYIAVENLRPVAASGVPLMESSFSALDIR